MHIRALSNLCLKVEHILFSNITYFQLPLPIVLVKYIFIENKEDHMIIILTQIFLSNDYLALESWG